MYLALLVELAGLHEERGEYGPAIEALRRVGGGGADPRGGAR